MAVRPSVYPVNPNPSIAVKERTQSPSQQPHQNSTANNRPLHIQNQVRSVNTTKPEHKQCLNLRTMLSDTSNACTNSVYRGFSNGSHQHMFSKSRGKPKGEPQDSYIESRSKATISTSPSTATNKGKSKAVDIDIETAPPVLQNGVRYLSPTPNSKVEYNTVRNSSTSHGFENSSDSGNYLQIRTEGNQGSTGPSSAVLVGPDVIDRHFNEWLRALHPDSELHQETLPLPTAEASANNSNWSSLRKAVTRAAQDPYSYVCPLPDSGNTKPVLLYPFSGSEIPDENADAFEMITDTLQANINRYAQSGETEVHYELWMCGTSKSDAFPSIVVICKKDVMAEIESILLQPHILERYSIVAPLSKVRKLNIARIFRRPRPAHERPKFNLYFCPRDAIPAFRLYINLGQVDVPAFIQNTDPPYGWVWSGSKLIVGQNKTSTLTCFLRIGSETFGLTTAHGFKGFPTSRLLLHKSQSSFEKDKQQEKEARANSLSVVRNKRESRTAGRANVTELLDDNGNIIEGFLTPVLPKMIDVNGSRTDTEFAQFPSLIPCSIIHPIMNQQSTRLPDLDWALIKIQQGYLELMLRLLTRADLPGSTQLRDIDSSARPRFAREVVIYTSTGSQTKHGILLPGVTYQAVSSRSCKTSLWSIAPIPDYEFLPGDSGSLVVDSSNRMVYGYVVSINTFGFAQVVPLYQVIGQMQSAFEIGDVQLETWSHVRSRDAYRSTNNQSGRDTNLVQPLQSRNRSPKHPSRYHTSGSDFRSFRSSSSDTSDRSLSHDNDSISYRYDMLYGVDAIASRPLEQIYKYEPEQKQLFQEEKPAPRPETVLRATSPYSSKTPDSLAENWSIPKAYDEEFVASKLRVSKSLGDGILYALNALTPRSFGQIHENGPEKRRTSRDFKGDLESLSERAGLATLFNFPETSDRHTDSKAIKFGRHAGSNKNNYIEDKKYQSPAFFLKPTVNLSKPPSYSMKSLSKPPLDLSKPPFNLPMDLLNLIPYDINLDE